MKSVHEGKEKLVANMILYGAIAFIVGTILFWPSFVMHLTPVMAMASLAILGGAVSLVSAAFVGLRQNAKITGGPTRETEGRVQARYAINHLGEMLFDNFDFDAPHGAKYYVKVKYPDGQREELETARPVFDQAGEGMLGKFLIQGNWLTRFSMLPDSDESRAFYRELG